MKVNHEGTKERKHEKGGLKVGDWVRVFRSSPCYEIATGKVVTVSPPYCKVLVAFGRERKTRRRAYRINDVLVI